VPKKARAITYHVEERYGLIWVCMGTPADDIPPLPEWDKPGFVSVHTGPYYLRCNGLRGVENVLDISHLPFVHSGLLGDDAKPEPIPNFDVHVGEDGVRTSAVRVRQPMGDHRRMPTESRYTFWCNRPLTGHTLKRLNDTECFTHYMNFQPTEDNECILWVITSTNFDTETAPARILDRNDEIFLQDKPILESQRPAMLPLDLGEEVHSASDKFTLYYRNWLRDLGVTTGAA
jgi:phenylpropionate dioxygenase-like ring-hydroxylating dioxygenase large terminal subunit